ncbi:uncharacterized protein P884DRAFT_260738 [Thermothelomyces heterothallicus CBS 202.75]|uniref:uncharacterized protein n=1 Tax=Thermothelomyces heterothallicus CBS 202.75 TaxID=1149848 RepID=UPI003742BFBA
MSRKIEKRTGHEHFHDDVQPSQPIRNPSLYPASSSPDFPPLSWRKPTSQTKKTKKNPPDSIRYPAETHILPNKRPKATLS